MCGSGTTYNSHAISGGKCRSELDLQAKVFALVQMMAPRDAISLKMLREQLQSRMRMDLSGCKPAIRRYAVQELYGGERLPGSPDFKGNEPLTVHDGPHGNTCTHLADGGLDVKAAASHYG